MIGALHFINPHCLVYVEEVETTALLKVTNIIKINPILYRDMPLSRVSRLLRALTYLYTFIEKWDPCIGTYQRTHGKMICRGNTL